MPLCYLHSKTEGLDWKKSSRVWCGCCNSTLHSRVSETESKHSGKRSEGAISVDELQTHCCLERSRQAGKAYLTREMVLLLTQVSQWVVLK